jgi:hypothetical protein
MNVRYILRYRWLENELEYQMSEKLEVHRVFRFVFKCGVGADPTRWAIKYLLTMLPLA